MRRKLYVHPVLSTYKYVLEERLSSVSGNGDNWGDAPLDGDNEGWSDPK